MEYTIIWQIATAFGVTGLAAILYSMGGRAVKALRRFVAPAVILAGLIGISLWTDSFSWYLLAAYPILMASWMMGYSNDKGTGGIKRFVISCVILLLSGLFAWHYGNYGILIAHAVMCFLTVFVGLRGIVPAAAEEFVICTLQVFPLFWYLFK